MTWPEWPGRDLCLCCLSPAFRQGCSGLSGSSGKEHAEVLLLYSQNASVVRRVYVLAKGAWTLTS